MSDEIFFDGVRYISAAEAALSSDLTRDYVARLCRDGKVRGRQVGRNWYIEDSSLKKFLIAQSYSKSVRRESLSYERSRTYHTRSSMQGFAAAAAGLPARAADMHEKVIQSAAKHGDVFAHAAKYVSGQGGVADAAVRAMHVPIHAVSPAADLVQRLIAATLAVMLTFGTYALVDPAYARFAAEHVRASTHTISASFTTGSLSAAHIASVAQSQLALAAENPGSALASLATSVPRAGAKLAALLNRKVDSLVYAIAFPLTTTASNTLAGFRSDGTVAVTIAPYRAPKGGTETNAPQRPATTQTILVRSPLESRQNSLPQTGQAGPSFIERVIERERLVIEGGITEEILALRLNELDNKLSSRLYGITAISSPPSSGGFTNTIALTNRIDSLTKVAIADPTITGGTMANTDITGGTITNTAISNSSIGATSLSVSGETSLATTTVTGDLTVSGDTTITGTLDIPGALSISSSTISLLTAAFATTSYISAVDASTTRLTWVNATGTNTILTNATSTNFFATNASTTNATSTNLFSVLSTFTSSVISTLTAAAATITDLIATTITTTNLVATNATTTNATSTNLFTTNLTATNATTTTFASYGTIWAPALYATSTAATSTFAGGLLATRAPTSAHTFAPWSIGTTGVNPFDASLVVNPASAVGDSSLITASVGGSIKFLVDAEGDVFANNITSAGSVSLAATNISTLSVEGNSTLGDSITDVTTVNGSLVVTGTTTASTLQGNFGIGTTSPYARLSLAGAAGGTANLIAVSTSTAGFATTTALTMDANGNLSLLNGAGLTVSGTQTFTGLSMFNGGFLSLASSTITSGLFSMNGGASTTNFTASGTSWLSTLTATGDTTLANATSTNIFSTVASSTNLFSSTASFGTLAANSITFTNALAVASGGTGASSFGQGWVYSNGGTGALAASTSPTVAWLTATSTTYASTFPYASTTAFTASLAAYLGTTTITNLAVTNTSTSTFAGATTWGANWFNILSTGQVALGTAAADASALLQIDSTTKGFLGPRMSTAQKLAISNPAAGLTLYDSTLNKLNVYNGSAWKNVGSTEINGEVTNGTEGSILFVDTGSSGPVLEQDNGSFSYASSTHTLTLANLSLTAGTTTSFFATTASSTNLYASLLTVGGTGLAVDASRRVGIGIASPTEQLEVNGVVRIGTADDAGMLNLGDTLTGSGNYTNGIFRGGLGTTAGGGYLNLGAWTGIAFNTSGTWLGSQTTRMVIDGTTGNVGIGNTSPNEKLNVQGYVAAQAFTATSSAYTSQLSGGLIVSGTTTLANATSTNFFAATASSTSLFSQTASLGALTASTLTTTGLSTFAGFLSNASSTVTSGLFSMNGGASTTAFTNSGATWLTSLTNSGLGVDANGKVYAAATTTFSTGLTYANGNVTNTGILSLAQTYGTAQTGALTIATSSDTNLLLNITNTGGAFTFAPVWTGTLAAARLNGNVVQAITNDTNVTGSISNQNLTLGWTGTLAASRGGTGQDSSAWNGLGAVNSGVWSAISTTSMNASITGNAGTATALQTARNINGVSFNGTADITITAASSTLLANNNTFSGNNMFLASTTIGNGTQTGGLTISGGATTTGNAYFAGSLGVGALSLSASAAMQIDSTTQGFLGPRMTTAQKTAIASPAAGLMLYDSTLNKLNVYNGSAWKNVGSTEINGEVTNGTEGSILFIGDGDILSQDNTNFTYSTSTSKLSFPYASSTAITTGTGYFTTASTTNLTVSSLTANRVPYITTAGAFTDSANLTFDGTTLTAANLTSSGNVSLGHATSTSLNVTTLGIGGTNYFTSLTGSGLLNTLGVLTLDRSGDWTGTLDGADGSYYLANSFSTTSAIAFVHASTTIPKTYTDNAFTGNNTFTNATTTNLFSTTASSTNLFSTNGNIGALTAGTLSLTAGTTTNLFSTTASSTNLFSQAASVGTLAASGAATFSSTLGLTGLGTFANGYVSQASSTVIGDFTATGNVTHGGTLTQTGLATFTNGFLSNASSTITTGLFSMNGGASTTNLTVSGTGYFGTLNPTTDNTALLGTSTLRWSVGNFGPAGINIWNTNGANYEQGSLAFSSNILKLSTAAPVGGNNRDIQLSPGNSSGLYLNTSGQAGLGYTSTMDTSVGTALMVNGRIGIGTTSPSGPLVVPANGRATGDLRYGLQIVNTDSANTKATNIAFAGGGGTAAAAGNWFIGTDLSHNGTDEFYIATSTGPTANRAFTFGSDNALRLANAGTVSSGNKLYAQSGNLFWDGTQLNGAGITNYWSLSGSNLSVSSNTYKVGVGTSTPFAKFAIHANNGETNTRLFEIASSTASATTSLFTVLNTGNVGIGTTSPAVRLHVESATAAVGWFNSTNADGAYLGLHNNTTVNGYVGSGKAMFGSGNASDFGISSTQGSSNLLFGAAGAEKMRITSAGNVGIGTTTPGTLLDISGSSNSTSLTSTVSARTLRITNTDTTANNSSQLAFATVDTAGNTLQSSLISSVFTSHTSGSITSDLAFHTRQGGSGLVEAMRINSSGNVGIGTTTPIGKLSVAGASANPNVQFMSGSASTLSTISTGRTGIDMTLGTVGATNNFFTGTSAGDSAIAYGTGKLFIGGGNLNVGGTFSTVFDSSGNVGIGATSPTYKLDVSTTTIAQAYSADSPGTWAVQQILGAGSVNDTGRGILFNINTEKGAGIVGVSRNTTGGRMELAFLTSKDNTTGERMRIDENGNVGIGTTTTAFPGVGASAYLAIDRSALSQYAIATFNNSTGVSGMLSFSNPNGMVGSITTSGSATAYNTSSDRRIKENIATTTSGLGVLSQIPVRDFDFKGAPGERIQGFIAQELYDIYPYAVSTNGDNGIDPLGASSSPWQVDYGRLTPLIVRSVQELNTKVDSILNGTATSTITNVAYQNASTTATDNLCLGGSCITAWDQLATTTASGTPVDLSSYATLSSVNTLLASATSTLSDSFNFALASASSSLTNTFNAALAQSASAAASALNAATSSLYAQVQNEIAALAGDDSTFASHLVQGTGTVNAILANWAFSSSTPDGLSFVQPLEGFEPSGRELTIPVPHQASGFLQIYHNLSAPSLVATSSVWTPRLAVTEGAQIRSLALGDGGLTFTDGSFLNSASGLVSTSSLASSLMPLASKDWVSALLASTTNYELRSTDLLLGGILAGNILPAAHNTLDLGSNENRFANIYAQNIHAGDLTFTETTSAISGEAFTAGDMVSLYVTTTGANTATIPVNFKTAINSNNWGSNNIFFNTTGSFAIGVASTTAPRGKLDVEGAIASGDSRFLTLANTSGANGNAALPYSFYIPSTTGDLNLASNDNGNGSLVNSSYSAWNLNIGGQSDAFSIKRSASGSLSYSSLFNITSAGKVGIGTSSPMNKLTINTETATDGLRIQSSAEDASVILDSGGGVNDYPMINFYKAGSLKAQIYVDDNTDNDLYFSNNGSGDDFLFSGGNVGIGTTTPSGTLHVESSNATAQLAIYKSGGDAYTRTNFYNNSAANSNYWQLAAAPNNTAASAIFNFYYPGAGNVMSLLGNGNVGIGTTSPGTVLEVGTMSGTNYKANIRSWGSTLGQGISLLSSNASYSNAFTTGTADSFNTGDPTNSDFIGGLFPWSATGGGLTIIGASNAAGVPALAFEANHAGEGTSKAAFWFNAVGDSSNDKAALADASNLLQIANNGSAKLTVLGSGNVGIGVTPSAWESSWTALQMKNGGSLASLAGINALYLSSNAYSLNDQSSKYIATDYATRYQQYNGEHRFDVAASGTAGNAITWTRAMTINSSGNVGIGTTSPAALLGVSSSNTSGYASYIYNSGQGAGNVVGGLNVHINDNDAADIAFNVQNFNGNVFRITGAGNVGIGTTTPDATLSIRGLGQTTAALNTASGQNLGGMIQLIDSGSAAGNGGGVLFAASNGDTKTFAAIKGIMVDGSDNASGDIAFSTRTNDVDATLTEKMRILTSGNVGIGATSPIAKLDVTNAVAGVTGAFFGGVAAKMTVDYQGGGDTYYDAASHHFRTFAGTEGVTITGNNGTYVGTWTQSSDARIKNTVNTLPAESGLATLSKLRPVTYFLNSAPEDGQQMGFIAQEVQPIYPDLVVNSHMVSSSTPDGMLSLNYTGLIAPMVKAIQELDARTQSILNGTATSTITNVAYTNASTTATDTLCLGGSCITAWDQLATTTAFGQPVDLSAYATLSNVNALLASATSTLSDSFNFALASSEASAKAGLASATSSLTDSFNAALASSTSLWQAQLAVNASAAALALDTATSSLFALVASTTAGLAASLPDFTTFATASDLASTTDYVLRTTNSTPDLSNYLTFADLSQYATTADLNSFVSTSSLASALTGYATFADIPSPVSLANLSGTVTGSIMPQSHNQYDLGSNDNRFANIYAQNIHAGDLTFTETTSAISGEAFSAGDMLSLYVTSTGANTATIPINFKTAINSNNWGSNNIFFNTSGSFAIGVASTTAPRGKLDVEGAIASGDSRFLTIANTSGANGNAALPYSFYIPSTTGDLNLASNDNGNGSLVNTSYSAWNVNLGGQSDTFSIKRSASGSLSYSSLFNITSAGNVGIGTTSPRSTLDIASGSNVPLYLDSSVGAASGNYIRFTNSGTSKGYFGWVPNGSGGLGALNAAGGAVNFLITDAGNVGIGTTTPTHPLSVLSSGLTTQARFSNGGATGGLYLLGGGTSNPSGFWIGGGTDYNGSWTARGDTEATILAANDGTFTFYSNSGLTDGSTYTPTARVSIDASGNVGIGTANPGASLEVNGGIKYADSSTDVYLQQSIRPYDEEDSDAMASRFACSGHCNGSSANKVYTLNITGNDPYVVTGIAVNPSIYKYLVLRYKTGANFNASGTTYTVNIGADQSSAVNFNLIPDGKWHTAVVDISSVNGGSTVSNLRIDFPDSNAANGQVAYFSYLAVGSIGSGLENVYAKAGNVGIGTTTPQGKLEIGDSTNGQLASYFTNSNSGTSAYSELTVRNDYVGPTTVGGLRLLTLGTGFTTSGRYIQDSAVIEAGTGLSGGLGIATAGATPLMFYTNGNNERMRIDSTGNVGIGTTSNAIFYSGSNTITPKTVISGATDILALLSSDTTIGAYLDFASPNSNSGSFRYAAISGVPVTTTAGSEAGELRFFTTTGGANITQKMVIDKNGNVGIGTTTPGSLLSIESTTGPTITVSRNNTALTTGDVVGNLDFYTNDTSAAPLGVGVAARVSAVTDGVAGINQALTFSTRAAAQSVPLTEYMRITSAGNVGIGTTNPQVVFSGLTSGTTQRFGARTRANGEAIGGLATGQVADFGGFYSTATAPSSAISFGAQGATGGQGAIGFLTSPTDTLSTEPTMRMVITKDGNVGIGTASPAAAVSGGNVLDVKSQINVTNSGNNSILGLRGTNFGYSASYKVLQIGATTTATAQTVSIGYDPAGNTDGSFTGDGGEVLFRNGVKFTTPNAANTGFHLNTLVLSGGNVGIGTTNPNSKLHTAGALTVQGAVATGVANSTIVANSSGQTQIWALGPDTSTSGNFTFIVGRSDLSSSNQAFNILANGNVGIGTTTPQNQLVVHQSTNLTTQVNGGSIDLTNANALIDFKNAYEDDYDARIILTGNDAIEIQGALFSGDFNDTSDERLKSNRQTLTQQSGLAAINQLNPISFEWADGRRAGTQMGFSAQEVRTVFPDLVFNTGATSTATPDGTLTLKYTGLIAPMVLAVQELSDKFDLALGATTTPAELTTASSTVASTTPWIASLASVSDGLKSAITSAFAAITNPVVHVVKDAVYAATGIFQKVFAGEVHTDKLCVSKSDGTEVCVTGDQLAAALAGQVAGTSTSGTGSSGANPPEETPSPAGEESPQADTEAPVISINGANPTTIDIGTTYSDLGANVTDNADQNLGIKASVDGGELTDLGTITLDTSTAGTHTIEYTATDQAGNTGTATRTVNVVAPDVADPAPEPEPAPEPAPEPVTP